MRTFFILLSKELRSFFLSPVAWVVLAMFMAISGFSFSWAVDHLREKPMEQSVVQWTFVPPWFWVYYPFVFALITMRLFAEEQKQGTLESLLTAPVRAVQVLLAKYFSAVIFYLILWLPVLAFFGVLNWVMKGKVEFPPGALAGCYLILLLTGLFHIALGMLASALTKNQIIAAILGFALIILHFLIGVFLQTQARDHPKELRNLVDHVAIKGHIDSFSAGLLDTRPMVYYLSFTVLLLAATHQVLEYRRWKA
ncbi:MAG TPA: ABC transporter permease [Verrucomicrobiales bacterium]|nr:ABC transporter permease [Verrucomicrobiales bacterium]